MIPSPETEVSITTRTSVSQQLAVLVMIGAGVAASFGIAAGLLGNMEVVRRPKGPVPMRIMDIVDVSLYTSTRSWETHFNAGYTLNGSVHLGAHYGNEYFPEENGFVDDAVATSALPLSVEVNGIGEAMYILINTGASLYPVCVPARETAGIEVVYWVDSNGNTYYEDPTLRRRSNPVDCREAFRNTLRPVGMTDATIEPEVVSDTGAKVEETWLRNGATLGTYAGSTGAFTQGTALQEPSGPLPLSVQVGWDTVACPVQNQCSREACGIRCDSSGNWIPDATCNTVPPCLGTINPPPPPQEFTFPAHLAQVTTDSGIQTLCVPETTVNENAYSDVTYYYNRAGTPFHDAFLTRQVMSASCTTLLANAFRPVSISDARTYGSVSPLYAEFFRGGQSLGFLSLNDNSYDPGSEASDSVLDPLRLQLSPIVPPGGVIIPSEAITVTYTDHPLCVDRAFNGGFEVDDGTDFDPNNPNEDNIAGNNRPDGWMASGSQVTRSTTEFVEGSRSVQLTSVGSQVYDMSDIVLETGKRYAVTGSFKHIGAGQGGIGLLRATCGTGGPAADCTTYHTVNFTEGTDFSQTVTGDSNGWTQVRYEFDFNNPNLFLRVGCFADIAQGHSGDTTWCDDIRVVEDDCTTSTQTKTLCVGIDGIGQTPVEYYYDADGMPYRDVFLQERVQGAGTCDDQEPPTIFPPTYSIGDTTINIDGAVWNMEEPINWFITEVRVHDNVGITSVTLTLDGDEVREGSLSGPAGDPFETWVADFSDTTIGAGVHSLLYEVTDVVGNVAELEVHWTVNICSLLTNASLSDGTWGQCQGSPGPRPPQEVTPAE